MRRWLSSLFNSDDREPGVFDWHDVRHQPVHSIRSNQLHVGNVVLNAQSLLVNGPEESLDMAALKEALDRYGGSHPLNKGTTPQLAALIYDATGRHDAMTLYFSIKRSLNVDECRRFEEKVQQLMRHPNFVCRISAANRDQFTGQAPPSIVYLVAGHVVEVFFHRDDLLSTFFSGPRRFDIYLDQRSYEYDGGVEGGCYDPRTQSVKLVASRLYEGFYRSTPGVAPFLHEFGHMLDAFHADTAEMGKSRGMLPGMFEQDGDLYTPDARRQFIQGKKIELERYERARHARPDNPDEIPIGHPYVFQNDGEFIAGYLEMFFRNPHRFAELNPALFDGFAFLFNQDPRDYWAEDFDFYVEENRKVYLEHRQGITPPGLSVFS